ncbi:MAG: tetrapyrrole methylase family protein / MazG family protein [Acidimicrobiaceae bacterium]
MRAPGRIVVVGLGPGNPDHVTAGTLAAIARIPVRFVRTTRHPSASLVPDATSFDDVYEAEDTFGDVYERIADVLAAAASEHGEVLYAVPGSPGVLERSVELLRVDERVDVEVVPGVSFLELAWVRLGVDPIDLGARLVDGHRFATMAAGERGPLLVAHCHNRRVLSDIKLAIDIDGPPVTVLQRLGLDDEAVFDVERAELDRSFEPDHLTAIWLADAAAPVASEVARFDELVHLLRERCPWDASQTHRSLTRHLLEETYEVLDAINGVDVDTGAGYDHLEEELGDLLFQICFHATLAGEQGAFTLADVARGINDKLIARHPHVFGGEHRDWEDMKREEKGRTSAFDGIPVALPALAYAAKVVGKARLLGVDVVAAPITEGDLGDALLALSAAAKALDIDPEAALRAAANELRARAEALE